MKSIVFLFSGQGAQYYQMGTELYAGDPVYRATFDRCAEITGMVHGRSLVDSVFGKPMAESYRYDDLEETNLALLAQGYATAQSLLARGIYPDALAGYSLGELIAATVANAITLEDALSLTRAQARHIMNRVPMAAMVAVLGSPSLILENPSLAALGEIGCINSTSHFVMTLALDNVDALTTELDHRDVSWARLPVKQGFHGALLDAAEPGYSRIAEHVKFSAPEWPVYSSLLAARVERFDSEHFWKVARGLVRFRDLITNLWAVEPRVFVDCGPTGTLAALVKQQLNGVATTLPSMNQFGRDLETMTRVELAIKAEAET